MTEEEKVKAKYPDALLSMAFAVQKDKTRRWMWCVTSMMSFIACRGKKKRVANVGLWSFTEAAAWHSAADELLARKRHGIKLRKPE